MNETIIHDSNRNYSVELFRFIFCFLIINYHFFSHFLKHLDTPNFFARGYLGDEYFFIVSGFFFAKAASTCNIDPIVWNFKQLIKRIKKIAVPYYLTWFLCFIGVHLTRFLSGESNKNIIFDAANSIYELLFLEMFGFKKGFYSNDVAWFFSALIIVVFILGPLVAKYKKRFMLFGAPLIALFSYGVLSLNYDLLHNPYVLIPNTFVMKGIVRAMAAICVGIWLAGIVENSHQIITTLQSKKLSAGKFVCVIDILLWILILAYMLYPFSTNSGEFPIQYDYIVVVIMAFALLPVLGNLFPLERKNKKNTGVVKALGRYAFFAYFGQAVFYSVDDLIYSMKISILAKWMVLNFSVPVLSILLFFVDKTIKKVLLLLCKTMYKQQDKKEKLER